MLAALLTAGLPGGSMLTAERLEILELLVRLSELTPDVHFGQLMANLSYLAIGPTTEAIWDMEEEQLLTAIRQHIASLARRWDDPGEMTAGSGSCPGG